LRVFKASWSVVERMLPQAPENVEKGCFGLARRVKGYALRSEMRPSSNVAGQI
jgi:hypothetical protein